MASDTDRAIRAWLIRNLGSSDVAARGLLLGSTSATLHCYRVVLPRGSAVDVVVKQYKTAIPHEKAQELAGLEVNGILAAAQTRVPVPRLLLHDVSGDATGYPAVAMTRLAGKPRVRFDDDGLDALGETLNAIAHSTPSGALPVATSWREASYAQPDWIDSALWTAMMQRVDHGFVSSASTFIHRDYHPGNVLFHEGLVSGVVDWVHASRGPVEFDISRCRVNIALIANIAAADVFTRGCRELAASYDVAWDLETIVTLLGHVDVLLTANELGANLTPPGIRETLKTMAKNALIDT